MVWVKTLVKFFIVLKFYSIFGAVENAIAIYYNMAKQVREDLYTNYKTPLIILVLSCSAIVAYVTVTYVPTANTGTS